MPSYVTEILKQLGWSDGTYLPISNEENKALEALLEARNKELEILKAENEIQDNKQRDIDQHRKHLQIEHQENMHLLSVHKEQLDNEDHLNRLAEREISSFTQDIDNINKQCKEIDDRSERVQGEIARTLRIVESLRNSMGEERGALVEWEAALQRGEEDIMVISKFTKEDTLWINELDKKRQRLKVEYDKQHALLSQVCGDLHAEERAAERISCQIAEALSQRRQIVATWTGAVENLRQRDRDIKNMNNELEMMREFAKKKSDFLKEKQNFLDAQKNNNAEAERELADKNTELTHMRQKLQNLQESDKSLTSELISAKRELVNTCNELSDLRIDNKRLIKEDKEKNEILNKINEQMKKYNAKLEEVMDGSKTAAQRIKQLEDMIINEEKYIKQLQCEHERAQHCLYRSQQTNFALQEKEIGLKVLTEGYRNSLLQVDIEQVKLEKELLTQEEKLYKVNSNLEKTMAQVAKIKGDQVIDDEEAEQQQERIKQMTSTLNERNAAAAELTKQIARLEGECNFSVKYISTKQTENDILQERLKELTAQIEGTQRDLKLAREEGRTRRADEGALRLRASLIERTLQHLGRKAYSVEKAQLDLETAISERLAEIEKRREVLITHRRTLHKEVGSLAADIRTEELRVDQLKKRYEIFVSFLGRDEMGEALSFSYFKIKNAQERSELQIEGDLLDTQIRKGEQEIAALETTLQVVDTINRNFVRSLDTVNDDDPEMIEYNKWCVEYDKARERRSKIAKESHQVSDDIEAMEKEIVKIEQQIEELQTTKDEVSDEIAVLQKEINDQKEKIIRANNIRKKYAAGAKKKINDSQIWSLHEQEVEMRILSESNKSASSQLHALGSPCVEQRALELGINLPLVPSGSLTLKPKGSHSNRSSLMSEQEAWTQRTSGSSTTVSEHIPVEGQAVTTISEFGDRLLAVRDPRTPLSDRSQEEEGGSLQSMQHFQKPNFAASSSSSINVVMLDLDPGLKKKTEDRSGKLAGSQKVKKPCRGFSTLSKGSRKSFSSTKSNSQK